jgi:hypothetical protein
MKKFKKIGDSHIRARAAQIREQADPRVSLPWSHLAEADVVELVITD